MIVYNTAHARAKAQYAVDMLASEIMLSEEDFARVALLLLDQAGLSLSQQEAVRAIVGQRFEGISP